jgi:hypothetical protein
MLFLREEATVGDKSVLWKNYLGSPLFLRQAAIQKPPGWPLKMSYGRRIYARVAEANPR